MGHISIELRCKLLRAARKIVDWPIVGYKYFGDNDKRCSTIGITAGHECGCHYLSTNVYGNGKQLHSNDNMILYVSKVQNTLQ